MVNSIDKLSVDVFRIASVGAHIFVGPPMLNFNIRIHFCQLGNYRLGGHSMQFQM